MRDVLALQTIQNQVLAPGIGTDGRCEQSDSLNCNMRKAVEIEGERPVLGLHGMLRRVVAQRGPEKQVRCAAIAEPLAGCIQLGQLSR